MSTEAKCNRFTKHIFINKCPELFIITVSHNNVLKLLTPLQHRVCPVELL